MASWEPVNRLRVRFELAVAFEALNTCSSDEEPRLDEESERGRLARTGAINWGLAARSVVRAGGCVEVLLYTSASRLPRLRDALVNGKATRRALVTETPNT
jgi:hypothetical protein